MTRIRENERGLDSFWMARLDGLARVILLWLPGIQSCGIFSCGSHEARMF